MDSTAFKVFGLGMIPYFWFNGWFLFGPGYVLTLLFTFPFFLFLKPFLPLGFSVFREERDNEMKLLTVRFWGCRKGIFTNWLWMDFIGNTIFAGGSAWCVYLLSQGEREQKTGGERSKRS